MTSCNGGSGSTTTTPRASGNVDFNYKNSCLLSMLFLLLFMMIQVVQGWQASLLYHHQHHYHHNNRQQQQPLVQTHSFHSSCRSGSSSRSSFSTYSYRGLTNTRVSMTKTTRDDDDNNEDEYHNLPLLVSSRRTLFFSSLTTTTALLVQQPAHCAMMSSSLPVNIDPRAIVTIRLESSQDKLGLELTTTTLRGQSIVVIQRILSSKRNTRLLQPGMIVLNYNTALDVIERIQQAQATTDFPLELQFYNLAGAGDAYNDLGQPMVTAQDALQLAQQTDDNNNNNNNIAPKTTTGIGQSKQESSSQQPLPQQQPQEYSKVILQKVSPGSCAIQSRRGDVLEINYEAFALLEEGGGGGDGDSNNSSNRSFLYDASSFRGTGQPYQMVLGSGDMLSSIDLGLYDMCPGEIRQLTIPSSLAYGQKGNKLYKIPPNTTLRWIVELISIDGTIRQDNKK